MNGPSLWVYCIESGSLYLGDRYVSTGYSGHDQYKNKIDAQNVKGLGPIPAGYYKIGTPFQSPNTGPYALALIPEKGTETYGRGSFEVHGDSIAAPGTASHGCIILPRAVREKIVSSGFSRLRVIERWDSLTGAPGVS